MRWGLWFAAFPLASCEDELPEIVAVGDRVRIAPLEQVPVCAGSVYTFERYLAETEDRLGLRRDGPLTIYWSPQAADTYCDTGESPTISACAAVAEGLLFTALADTPHELVHHVAFIDGGRSTPLFEEGVAVFASGGCVGIRDRPHAPPPPLESLVGERTRSSYAVGGSLVQFIDERWALEPALEIRSRLDPDSTADALRSAIEEVLETPFDEFESDWLAFAPHDVCGPYFPRAAGPALHFDAAELTIQTTLDCDDPNTEGPLDDTIVRGDPFSHEPLRRGMYHHRQVVIPTPADVELELLGPPGSSAIVYSRRCWDATIVGENTPGLVELVPDVPQVWTLGGCVWEVFLIADDPDAVVDVSLSIRSVEP